jgi:hypothetical protein
MRYILLPYVLIGLMFACWLDAMNAAYPTAFSRRSDGLLAIALMAAAWPLSLPLSMGSVALDGGRWDITPSTSGDLS